MAPASRITATTILLRQSVVVSPSDRFLAGSATILPVLKTRLCRSSTQEAEGALDGRYRASRYFKLNTIATMAKTIGQKMLASGPTVPPVSQRGPLNDAFSRFSEGSKPLFGTPYKNV